MEKLTDADKFKLYRVELKTLIEEQKEVERIKDLLNGGYTINDLFKMNHHIPPIIIAKLKSEKIEKIDNERIKQLERVIENISKAINDVDDETLKLILRLKIFEGKTYREIAKMTFMHFSNVRKVYKRFIKG